LARACQDIEANTHDAVLLVAGEAWYSRTRAQRAGQALELTQQDAATPPPTEHGSLIEFVHPVERSLGIVRPIQEYPLFEQALRVQFGHTPAEHQLHLGRFAERLSVAAQANPYAWDRGGHTAIEIATATPTNRYVGSPYTKLMVSNEQVDMAAALIVMSAERATALGIARDRWVFPLAASSGESRAISERLELYDSVLAREVAKSVASVAGRRCDEAAHVDLYSCFPSAVQIQARELGLDPYATLSLTGGMRFGGGPWCGYSMHGFAAMIDALRDDAGSLGLVSANGGAITKLVVTLLSTTPSPRFAYESAQPAIDAAPRRTLAERYEGPATIESYTVMHGSGGHVDNAIVAARTPDDRRAWGVVRDADAAAYMVDHDMVGRRVTIASDGAASCTG
jgi:acetyl-CoA C-acetyltransferase